MTGAMSERPRHCAVRARDVRPARRKLAYFSGEKMTRRLSDPDKVLKQLGQRGVIVPEDWRSRAWIIRAGERPELGDLNRGQTLPDYYRVGRALAELRLPDKWLEYFSVIGLDKMEAAAWYGRFFGDEI